MPSVIFYDNACSFKKHLEKQGEHHFDYTDLPVDVFHIKTKHSDKDDYCLLNCNPADIPELMKDGKWRFNSSAAEMTNHWFGGFQSIAREMRRDRYEFFLDEMIKQRNRVTVVSLREQGHKPARLSRTGLLSSDM